MKLNFCFLLSICLVVSCHIFAQTKKVESATVTSFDDPYNLIVINKEDIGDLSFTLDSTIIIKNKKGKTIMPSELQEGHEVTVLYEIKETEEGKKRRALTGIELLTEAEEGKTKFKGLFEGYDKDVAFIDGRKVKLAKNATFKGVKKGDGKINIDFIGFDDDLLKRGYYMDVKGNAQSDGIIIAEQILVRKNTQTKDDEELIGLVSKGFSANGVNKLQVPGGIFNAANGLYNGNIAIGGVNYKLANDIKLQGYINEVGYRLIPEYTTDGAWQKENQKIDFRFYVIDDQVPNAFAWPNGMVFIHTGLLKIIENEAQLAFVLSHEISHVLYEHGSARFKKSEQIKDAVGLGKGLVNTSEKVIGGFGKIGGLIKKGKGINTATTGNNNASFEYYAMMQKMYGLGNTVSNTQSQAGSGSQILNVALNTVGEKITPDALSGLFAKDQENQADRVGLYYAQLAGYDIREAPKFWNKMMDKNNDPTFLGNVVRGFKSIIQNQSVSVNLSGDEKNQLLNSSAEMIVNNIFKTVYSSHPLTQNRLKSTNLLLTTTYQKKDYNSSKVGIEEYKSYMGGLQ